MLTIISILSNSLPTNIIWQKNPTNGRSLKITAHLEIIFLHAFHDQWRTNLPMEPTSRVTSRRLRNLPVPRDFLGEWNDIQTHRIHGTWSIYLHVFGEKWPHSKGDRWINSPYMDPMGNTSWGSVFGWLNLEVPKCRTSPDVIQDI